MDTREYAEALLTRLAPPAPSEVLKAAEQLTVPYLSHLLVMHKYLQELTGNDASFKRIQLLLMTRVVDGFVAGAHLLRARSYNASMTEMRAIFDALCLMKWLALCEPALKLYLSNNTELILREFRANRVREYLGRTPHDRIYHFLLSYHTHPFYTGKEYLLGVDLRPGNIPEPEQPHYPALDAVAAAIQLLTHAHTAYELATNFGLNELVKRDRDRLDKMYRDIDHYLAWVSKKIGPHRTIQAVIHEFHRHFPVLYDARFRGQQATMHKHFKLLQRNYANGTIPYPAPYHPAYAENDQAGGRASAGSKEAAPDESAQVTRSVLPQSLAEVRARGSASSAVLPKAVGPMDAGLPEIMDEPPPMPSGFGDISDEHTAGGR